MQRVRSVRQAAEATGLAEVTIRKMVSHGQIAHFKLGRRIVIPEDEIERIMAASFRPALPQSGKVNAA